MNVQVATRIPEEIRDEVAKYSKSIGLDIPTILRMAMYDVANKHRLPLNSEDYVFNKQHDLKNILQDRIKSGKAKLWKLESDDSGKVFLPANFPKELEEAWEL